MSTPEVEISDRIRIARETIGLSARAISKDFGVTAKSWLRWESGETTIPTQAVYFLVSQYGFNPEWIITGEGPVRMGPAQPGSNQVDLSNEGNDGFALIPRLDVEAAAGDGAVVESEQVRYTMSFRRDWIRQELSVAPDRLRIISARGDSMNSGQGRDMDIHDGDLLLVNTEVAAIDGDAIYAIQFDGCLVIKRLQRLIDGGIKVISANPAYEAQHISHGDVSGIHISGRVVYVIAGRRV